MITMRLKQLILAWLLMIIGVAAYAQNVVQTVEQVTEAVTLTDAVDYTITSANAPRIMLLPAPVSPVSTVNPSFRLMSKRLISA